MVWIAFTEAFTRGGRADAGLQALVRASEAARLQGWTLVSIPPDFEGVSAEDAISHLPEYPVPTPAIWIGYIPVPARYAELWTAAKAKNIHLLDDLEGHLEAQEFDRYYPRIKGLTPESRILHSADDAQEAGKALGFPVFVRGAVQSRKYKGLSACLAHHERELEDLVTQLLAANERSRGRVIARRFVPLRHVHDYQGFPQGREFRAFLLDGKVIALGYYWDQPDPLSKLSPHEEVEIVRLAETAASKLPSRWISIDVGQAETGEWWVIETGDAQFSGLTQISALELFGKLKAALSPTANP